jgi:enamine deaminase RidA (YjgF/YER057c/UK114 family)
LGLRIRNNWVPTVPLSRSSKRDLLLISNSFDYATGIISPSIVDQAERTLKNVEAALKEAGASMQDIVRVRYILPNGKDFPLIWPVLKTYFGDVRPAATMVQADLMEKTMKIEIEVTAKKGKDRKAKL